MYDEETGFYYLRSRYYDPEVGRFLNADSTGLVTADPTTAKYDKNLFAYCDNNPVNRADDGGEFWHIVAGAVVGGACGLISGAGASSVSSGTGGQKQMVNLGVNTVKRTMNELSHHGFKAYFREAGKATSYYLKNTIKNTRALFSIRNGISQAVNIGYSLRG